MFLLEWARQLLSPPWGNSLEVKRWLWPSSSSSLRLLTAVSVNWGRLEWCNFVMWVNYPFSCVIRHLAPLQPHSMAITTIQSRHHTVHSSSAKLLSLIHTLSTHMAVSHTKHSRSTTNTTLACRSAIFGKGQRLTAKHEWSITHGTRYVVEKAHTLCIMFIICTQLTPSCQAWEKPFIIALKKVIVPE